MKYRASAIELLDSPILASRLVAWCRQKNVRVRFHSNDTVEIHFNGKRRRRQTLREAVLAHDPEAIS